MKLCFKNGKYIDFTAKGWQTLFAVMGFVFFLGAFMYASTVDYYTLYM